MTGESAAPLVQPPAEAPATAPLLCVEGLAYAYYTQRVLDGVSFQMDAGELVALVGRNGAGKSTLLRCVAGWLRPEDGEARLLGRPVHKDEQAARRQVLLTPDTPPFYDELTAWEHLQLVAQAHHLPDWPNRAERLLARFGLSAGRDAYPFSFSRGMKYKLAICLALLVAPPLLLLDEPFGPLDPVSAERLWRELERARQRGTAVLFSSHQLPPGVQPDRYLVLEEGRIIAAGTPDELGARWGLPAPLALADLLSAALGAAVEDEATPEEGHGA